MAIRSVFTAVIFLLTAAGISEATERIAWYSTLNQGLEVARKTGQPILLVSAAPHCHGISGIW